METEPRAQRQIIASLRKEKARSVFSELTIPQLADLFTVIPHDQVTGLMELLPADTATRVKAILAEDETMAKNIFSVDFMAVRRDAKVGEVLEAIRLSGREPGSISYIYVTDADNILLGVVDLRELILAEDNVTVGDIMASPAVAAEDDDVRKDLAEMFAKYHYRMIPVVDSQDHLLGTIRYNDIMKGVEIRVKE